MGNRQMVGSQRQVVSLQSAESFLSITNRMQGKHTVSGFASLILPRLALLALFISFFAGMTAWAQFGASLNGTVEDSTGAVIPGAVIKLTNSATQQARTATSSSGGSYNFGELPPGSYNLTATAPNFKTVSVVNIQVAGETPRTNNITLAPPATQPAWMWTRRTRSRCRPRTHPSEAR